jgi:hypothetical protein
MSDMARFHNKHRTFGGVLLRAGRVVVLKVENRKTRVVARGPACVKDGEISLDSATRERLGVETGTTALFQIQKANLIDEFLWAWNATDAMPRVGARLGAISVILGFLGVALGALSLFITLCPQMLQR